MVIQFWCVLLIQSSLYFELFVCSTQPVYDMLEELGPLQNDFNYMTGWPLYFLVNYYYFLACWQNPGPPIANWDIANPYEGRFCAICKASKPVRCHHCARCGVCVVKRDHHCDFTNQCVGAGNYKAFFWFTFFTMIGCLHPGLRLAQWFYHYFMEDLESVNAVSMPFIAGQFMVMNMYFSMFWFTFSMTRASFRNSFTNCTRLDLLGDMENPPLCSSRLEEPMNTFDMGLCRNWINDFGWNPLTWFFPTYTNDEQSTYAAHRFPRWPTLLVEEVKQLQSQTLEHITPNATKRKLDAIAQEYREQRAKAANTSTQQF